jgi:tetratricopeptide (TPR) repeat protein
VALDKEKILELAQRYVLKGHSKKAIGEYIRLIEADPKDKRLYLKLGDLYHKNGEHEKAITQYLTLAGLFADEDLNSRAISIYKKILSINSKRIDALHNIAELYLKEGLRGDAKHYYQSILEITPDDQDARKALNDLDTRQKPGEKPKPSLSHMDLSLPNYPHSREIRPSDDKSDLFPSSVVEPHGLSVDMEILPPAPAPDKESEMHYHLGIAYKEMELFDYAISEFEIAASDPPIKFDCYIMLGSCFLEKGDNAQAIQQFQEAARMKGLTKEKLTRVHFNLGLAYEAGGMLSEAIQTFNFVLSLDHSFSEAREKVERLQQHPKLGQ